MAEQEKEKGLFGESFLAELLRISDPTEPVDEVPEGYRIIGEMNLLEKAAHTWISIQRPILEGLEKEVVAITEKYRGKGPFILDGQELATLSAWTLLDKKFEIIKQLLRVSVWERLKIPVHAEIMLAKGFVVGVEAVALTNKPIYQAFTTVPDRETKEEPDIPPLPVYH